MPKFTVLNNNVVENIIVADTLEIAQEVTGKTCVQLPSNSFIVNLGDLYDGTFFIPDRNVPAEEEVNNA